MEYWTPKRESFLLIFCFLGIRRICLVIIDEICYCSNPKSLVFVSLAWKLNNLLRRQLSMSCLNVAEKPSVAKAIAGILSQNSASQVWDLFYM